jgi:hypothetical protein
MGRVLMTWRTTTNDGPIAHIVLKLFLICHSAMERVFGVGIIWVSIVVMGDTLYCGCLEMGSWIICGRNPTGAGDWRYKCASQHEVLAPPSI